MRLLRQFALCCMICSGGPHCAKGAECKQVFTVQDIIRNGRGFDGQIICVRGMLVPTAVPEWSGDLFHELVPLPTKSTAQSSKARVGLVEWSSETGISEKYYKPDSFDLLSEKPPTRAPTGGMHRLDVTVRAAVMYKKNLRAKIGPIPPSPPQIKAMTEARYDVELVLLEILRVKSISDNDVHAEMRKKGEKCLPGFAALVLGSQ
jgi:hypothetical protein